MLYLFAPGLLLSFIFIPFFPCIANAQPTKQYIGNSPCSIQVVNSPNTQIFRDCTVIFPNNIDLDVGDSPAAGIRNSTSSNLSLARMAYKDHDYDRAGRLYQEVVADLRGQDSQVIINWSEVDQAEEAFSDGYFKVSATKYHLALDSITI